MKIKLRLTGALVVGFGLAAVPAAAVVKVATYTGTISSGLDATGVFGAPNTDLIGKTATIKFVYDINIGTRDSSPGRDFVYGGTSSANANPILKSSVTIDGVTSTINGKDGVAFVFGLVGTMEHQNNFVSMSSASIEQYQDTAINILSNIPASLADNMPQQTFTGTVSFLRNRYDYSTNATTMYATGSFNSGTVLITSGVPEPASWTMMIAGFGLVGIAARRRVRAIA